MTPELTEKRENLKKLREKAGDGKDWTLAGHKDWVEFFSALANDALPIIDELEEQLQKAQVIHERNGWLNTEVARLDQRIADLEAAIRDSSREGPHCPFCKECVGTFFNGGVFSPRPHAKDCIWAELKAKEGTNG